MSLWQRLFRDKSSWDQADTSPAPAFRPDRSIDFQSAGDRQDKPAVAESLAFLRAAEKGDIDLVRQMLSADGSLILATAGEYSGTALHWAANAQREKVLEFLVSSGADVNAKDKRGRSPLLIAMTGFYSSSYNMARVLLAGGANPNAQDQYGIAPMHFVAQDTNVDLFKLLTDNGADINLRDNDGNTPLHALRMTSWPVQGQNDVIKAFLDFGAEVNIKNKEGHTPLYYAVQQGRSDMEALLCRYGARV